MIVQIGNPIGCSWPIVSRRLEFGKTPFYSERAEVPYRDVLRMDPCAYCNGRGGTVDHIEALSAGGADKLGNLTGACLPCNQLKGSQSLLRFLYIQNDRRLRMRVKERVNIQAKQPNRHFAEALMVALSL